jgi:predicted dithiol-disulfide oxidoreductase (DUF899 family)
MNDHNIVSQQEWLAARRRLLAHEKQLTHATGSHRWRGSGNR